MILRDERPGDAPAIRHLVEKAFAGAEHSSGTEGAILDALRAEDALTLSLLAEEGGTLLGQVAFSKVLIAGSDCGWFGLGPVAVLPGHQGRGIGAALIREGLSRLGAMGAQGCVVLGDPGFYPRFGFMVDPALHLEGVPPEYFMRLHIAGPPPRGEVGYHPAFFTA